MEYTLEVSLQQDEQFPNNNVTGCILPWMHIFGSLSGNFYICCHAEYAQGTKVMGTYKQSLGEIWNSKDYKQARLNLLKGIIPTECKNACYDKEKQGSGSNRITANDRFNKYAYLQDETNIDGSLDITPAYLDIRFGNLCNFKCRMCGPYASTSWYKDSEDPSWSKTIDYFTDNEDFWKDVPQYIPNLEEIYFAGGEPFVQEGHYKMLTLLIESGYAKNIHVSYNTNLSYSKFKKYDLTELWSNFKKVSIWPSIEGYGSRVEYARKGLSWPKFEKHAIMFKEHIQTVSCVINIYSITSMPDLIIWCKRNGFDFYGSTQIEPPYQKVTCLPKESKQQVLNIYKKFIKEYRPILTSHDLEQIKNWLSYMTSTDESSQLLAFKQETERVDKLRNESFAETFPEFASWYETI